MRRRRIVPGWGRLCSEYRLPLFGTCFVRFPSGRFQYGDLHFGQTRWARCPLSRGTHCKVVAHNLWVLISCGHELGLQRAAVRRCRWLTYVVSAVDLSGTYAKVRRAGPVLLKPGPRTLYTALYTIPELGLREQLGTGAQAASGRPRHRWWTAV